VVLVDDAHFNTHTLDGRYQSLARIARRDGYQVRAHSEPFSAKSLRRARVLVVANALAESDRRREPPEPTHWSLPTPSAFTSDEIQAVRDWVERGGALLLLADHMPFAGAASKLASEFGIRFDNSFAVDERLERELGTPGAAIATVMVFRRAEGGLPDHPISNGRDPQERVDQVATFAGHAFRPDPLFQPLLVMPPSTVSLSPRVAWQFPPDTPRMQAGGWWQAAVRRFGRGRVAVFGETGLFGVQNTDTDGAPVGLNAPEAAQNPQFLLNLLHWLSGLLDVAGEA